MGIKKYKYTTYTCDICLEELSERINCKNRFGHCEGDFPILIGGKQLQLSGFREFLHRKPVVICQFCQNEIRERIQQKRKSLNQNQRIDIDKSK